MYVTSVMCSTAGGYFLQKQSRLAQSVEKYNPWKLFGKTLQDYVL